MSPTLYPPEPQLPVFNVDAELLDERNWRRVSTGGVVRTHFQAYLLLPQGGWQLTSFFTSDGQKVTGRTAYRSPTSLKAWLSIARPLAAKWWNRWRSK